MGHSGERRGGPPNIVMLVLDTARARNLSCYGNDRKTTPAIDALAADGVRFSRATSISPWTLPSHSSLFTGVPPSIHQTNSLESQLPDSLTTMAEMLRGYGYDTIGMSANPWFSSQFGIVRGFDKFHHLFGPFATSSYREFVMSLTDSRRSIPERAYALLSNQSLTELARNSITATHRHFVDEDDDGARKAVEHASETIGQPDPYFLFINFLEPHLPFKPPTDCRRRFIPDDVSDDRLESINQDATAYNIRNVEMNATEFDILERLYDAEIYHVDRQIKRILTLLEESSQLENTIVIVLGDHGENIGDHGLMAHHYSVHETLTHVPLIVNYPGVFDGGEVVNDRVSSLDVPATIERLMANQRKCNKTFKSQQHGVPLQNRNESQRRIFSEYLNPMPPIKRLREKSENPAFDVSKYDRQLRAIYVDNLKFVTGTDGHRALYDLSTDSEESENIMNERPERAKELEQVIEEWIKANSSELNQPMASPGETVQERLGDLGYL
ncbi:sulfatase [Natronomonas sp. EA1]|uniref:sulfatase n=1 Tax=Natronomonas sp. EA1 TaxID=3421655 RepID=UPI003EBE2671